MPQVKARVAPATRNKGSRSGNPSRAAGPQARTRPQPGRTRASDPASEAAVQAARAPAPRPVTQKARSGPASVQDASGAAGESPKCEALGNSFGEHNNNRAAESRPHLPDEIF